MKVEIFLRCQLTPGSGMIAAGRANMRWRGSRAIAPEDAVAIGQHHLSEGIRQVHSSRLWRGRSRSAR